MTIRGKTKMKYKTDFTPQEDSVLIHNAWKMSVLEIYRKYFLRDRLRSLGNIVARMWDLKLEGLVSPHPTPKYNIFWTYKEQELLARRMAYSPFLYYEIEDDGDGETFLYELMDALPNKTKESILDRIHFLKKENEESKGNRI